MLKKKKIFEVCTGSELFYGVGAGGLLGRMVRLVGEVPPLWASYWASNESLKDQGTPVFIYLFICPQTYSNIFVSRDFACKGEC